MDLKSGSPFWSNNNGRIATYPPLNEGLSAEIAIVGGGIAGALVAYHLSKAGVKVVLVDKREIAHGSTCASTALLQYEIDTPLHKLIRRIGKAHAIQSYKLGLEAIYKIEHLKTVLNGDFGFKLKKSFQFASTPQDTASLRREYRVRRSCGIHIDLLERKDVEKRFSFSSPSGILSYDAAQIDPFRLTHLLIQKARSYGLQVYDGTKIKSYVHKNNRVILLTENGHQIQARKIVLAAGYEAQNYLKKKITTLKSTYAIVSKPLRHFEGWYDRCLIWETADPYIYLRTTSDGRVMMGGGDVMFRNAARRDLLLPRKTRDLSRRFRQMFPNIDMEVAYAWSGTFGTTKDGLAYIGETKEFPHAYFALGYGGNGITYSLIAAEIIRDAFLGRKNKHAKLFRFER